MLLQSNTRFTKPRQREEIIGIEPEGNLDGISFLSTLLDKKNQQEHEFLYWEFPAQGGQQATRIGKWKGIRSNIFKGNLNVQLYNMEEDIREQNDVAGQYPEIAQQIEAIFTREHIPSEIERFRIKQLGD